MSMRDNRAALATLIRTTLQGFESRFRVVDRIRHEVMYSESPKERKRIMGDPTMYCHMLHTGRRYVGDVDALDRERDYEDEFTVEIWYRFRDHDKEANSSQREWDQMITDDTTGLLDVLRNEEWLDSVSCQLGTPRDYTSTIAPLSGSDMSELVHYASFTIGLRKYG